MPFSAGANVKIIGEEDEQEAEKKGDQQEPPTENMNTEDVANQVNKILKQTESPAPTQTSQPQTQPAPKPEQKPATAPIPIPMAVPESLSPQH